MTNEGLEHLNSHEAEEVKRSFQVEMEVVQRYIYIIDEANSQEEAESIAESLFELDEDDGEIELREIVSVDSFPIEGESERNSKEH